MPLRGEKGQRGSQRSGSAVGSERVLPLLATLVKAEEGSIIGENVFS